MASPHLQNPQIYTTQSTQTHPQAHDQKAARRATHNWVDDTDSRRVQQMFRELRSLPDGFRRVRAPAGTHRRAVPAAGRPHRPPVSGPRRTHDDLVQVARVGLLNAVNRFDPEAGDFLGFAVPTMMGEVKRYFRDYSWSVKVPRRLKELYPQLGTAMYEVAQRPGRTADPVGTAAETGGRPCRRRRGDDRRRGFKTLSIDFTALRRRHPHDGGSAGRPGSRHQVHRGPGDAPGASWRRCRTGCSRSWSCGSSSR